MKSIAARGTNYYGSTGFPLIVGRSRSHPAPPPHPHELTEIEHHHDCSELVIVSKGVGVQCLEGMDIQISSGDVFLLQGMQKHFFHHRQHLELVNVMYDPVRIALPESELLQMPGYSAMFMLEPTSHKQNRFVSRLNLNRKQLSEVEGIASRMETECTEKEPGHEVVLRAKLLELIAYLSRAYNRGASTDSQLLLRISNVIVAMEKDYCKPWKLDDLVAISNMSKSHLLSIFRKATGQTPIEYLMSIRIQRATEALLTTEKRITEIAFASGFNDSNYFTRQFRKITGKSPKEFRGSHQH